jgi:cation diffusion facilitator family transporter
MEYLTALIVNIMIIVVGFELLGSSIDKIKNPSPTNISSIFIILVALSIAVKLWLYFFYRTIGTTIDSTAIKATALDSLTDVLATSLVLVSSIISKHFTIQLDGWAGILMSGFILFAGVRALREPVELLLGSAPDPDYLTKIELFVKQYPDLLGIHDLIVHDYGPTRFIITLHAEISAEISLINAHEIIDQIEKDMQKHFHWQVIIHPDPITVNSK